MNTIMRTAVLSTFITPAQEAAQIRQMQRFVNAVNMYNAMPEYQKTGKDTTDDHASMMRFKQTDGAKVAPSKHGNWVVL